MLVDLLKKNRSYRRFYQSERISEKKLTNLVGLARYCSSAGNLQPLKYYCVTEEKTCDNLFHSIKWAAALPDWEGAVEGERPSAYIIQTLDLNISKSCLSDDGIQLEAISLGAVEAGLGVCIIKSFNLAKVKEILDVQENHKLMYIMALGKPKEEVVIEDLKGNQVNYWRDKKAVHHVPKRRAEDLVIKVSK